MLEKWKEFARKMNEKGIPVPLVRDNGAGSVSLTLVFISSLYVQFGLINNLLAKLVKVTDTVDVSNSLYWFSITAALYFGRKITKDKDKIEISKEDK